MEEIFLQQCYDQEIEEKKRTDDYECFIEDTAQWVKRMKLTGKARNRYLQGLYHENKGKFCAEESVQEFYSAVNRRL